jgi:hypothetical protein
MADIEALINEANDRATLILSAAQAELSGSASSLYSIASGNSLNTPDVLSGILSNVGDLVPYVPVPPPALGSVLDIDTSGAPTGTAFIPNAPSPLVVNKGTRPSATLGEVPTFAPIQFNASDGKPTAIPQAPQAPTPFDTDLTGAPTSMPDLVDIPNVRDITIAQPTFALPTYIEPAQPSAIGNFAGALPATNDLSIPDAPDLLNQAFTMPTLTNMLPPVPPLLEIPAFSASVIPEAPEAPTNSDGVIEEGMISGTQMLTSYLREEITSGMRKLNPNYDSQMSLMQQRLDALRAGGTGLKPEVENAIYERSKDKVQAEFERTVASTYAEGARRGFSIPAGAMVSAVQQARKNGGDANARAAVEIGVKMAEMEQQNLQTALTTCAQLVQSTIGAGVSYHQSLVGVIGHAISAAQAVVQARIQTYNAAVQAFSAKIDVYKAEISTYEIRIRGALAKAELYSAQIKAVEVSAQIDVAKITAYRTQVETLTAYANVYRAQVDAVVSKAQVERIKVDIFATQVQAYSAQVQAKTAEWQGYTAAVRGQETKVGIYTAQMNGYATQVSALKTQVEADTARIQAAAAKNRAAVDVFVSLNQVYGEKVRAEGVKASVHGEVEKLKLEANAQANAAIAQQYVAYGALMQGQSLAIQAQAENAKITLSAYEAKNKTYIAQWEGYKAELQAEGMRVQAEGETQRNVLASYAEANRTFTATWQAYAARMSAQGAKAQAQGEYQRNLIASYGMVAQAAAAQSAASAEHYRAKAQVAIETGRLLSTNANEQARIKVQAATSVAQTAVGAANVYGSMANAALAGMNTLVTQQVQL